MDTNIDKLREKTTSIIKCLSFFGGDGGNRSYASFICYANLRIFMSVRLCLRHTTVHGLLRFRLPQTIFYEERKSTLKGAFSFWWRWRKPKLRFVRLLCKPSHFYVRTALPCGIPPYMDYCGFDYLTVIYDIKKVPQWTPFLYGGDGGNRNRVRKSIPEAFYERSVPFKIPFSDRRYTG